VISDPVPINCVPFLVAESSIVLSNTHNPDRSFGINTTVLDITLEAIPPGLAGEYLIIAAEVPQGIDPLSYEFQPSEIQIKPLSIRYAFPRNTEYLIRHLQKLEENNSAYVYINENMNGLNHRIRSHFSERKMGTDPFNDVGCLVLPLIS